MSAHIVLLPGDGIGPEIVAETRRVLEALEKRGGPELTFDSQRIGGAAIDETGTALPDATLEACQRADAVLLGAVGGPKWDDPNASVRPEQGLLGIRKALELWANLRPVRMFEGLGGSSPLRAERLRDVDLLVVRELTGGIYFGEPRTREQTEGGERALDTMVYTDFEVCRVVQLAFDIARGRRKHVTSIDKANVLESSRLWRRTAEAVARDYPDVTLEHQLVDSAAMRLVTAPGSFDVIVAGNLFGDILSDEAAVLTGTLGLLPSASLNASRKGLYEPVHGSAPDIAGKEAANPLATILSAAMMLRHSLGLDDQAVRLEKAVERALADGCRTADLAAEGETALSTTQMGDAVIDRL